MNKKQKPSCKYGDKCYRKNSEHLSQFSHPKDENTQKEPPKKVFPLFQKKENSKTPSSKNDPQTEKPSSSSSKCEKDKEPEVKSNKKRTAGDSPETCKHSFEPEEKRNRTVSPVQGEKVDSEEKGEPNNEIDEDLVKVRKLPTVQAQKAFIEEYFLIRMPQDFFALWSLAKKLSPAEPSKAFEAAEISLCGPFDVLAGKFENAKALRREDVLIHDRYPLDPPEFQTVLKCPTFHVGYLRDDPRSDSAVLCTNTNDKNGWTSLKIIGDNLFAAVKHLLDSLIKANKTEATVELLTAVEKEAKTQKLSLEINSQNIRERKKKVVAPTVHGAGIVVPMRDDVGYRELPENNAMLKKMISSVGQCKDADLRGAKMEKILEIITYVQFANDECDYGMGLELGLDLFCSGYECFHPQIRQLLKVGYMLLNREEFGKILDAHLKQRWRKELGVL